MPKQFTDEQLRAIRSDPRFTAEDLKLMTPEDRQRFTELMTSSKPANLSEMPLDLATGAAKGLGETVAMAGRAVHNTPILGRVTDAISKAVGPAGTNPDAAFKTDLSGPGGPLQAQNTAQQVGKTTEQAAEFLSPAGATRKAAVKGLVKLIPDAASPAAMKTMNKVAAIGGRTLGEGAQGTAISALHGDEDPVRTGMISAAAPAAGAIASKTLPSLVTNPVSRAVLPVVAGSVAGHMTGNLTQGALGGLMGAYGLGSSRARKVLNNPQLGRSLAKFSAMGGEEGTKLSAGLLDQLRAQRRKLEGAR